MFKELVCISVYLMPECWKIQTDSYVYCGPKAVPVNLVSFNFDFLMADMYRLHSLKNKAVEFIVEWT